VCSFRKYCAPCLAQGDQVGVQPSVYAWYRFADVKNGKPFLEPQCEAWGAWLWMYAWYRLADVKNSKLFLELQYATKSADDLIPYIISYPRLVFQKELLPSLDNSPSFVVFYI
jgi:hypothetical protein